MGKEAEKRAWKVYRYEDANGVPIYVGRTVRPLKDRVREHKMEELMSKVAKIKYIELPNEAQMIQYEDYYINLYKPEYNIENKGEGVPVPLPEYTWILYKEFFEKINFSAYNLKVLEDMYTVLNDRFFNGEVNGYPTYSSYKMADVDKISIKTNTKHCHNGVDKYTIYIPEEDVLTNSEKVVFLMLSQMIQIWCLKKNINCSSRGGVYKNKKFEEIANRCGLVTNIKTHVNKYGKEINDGCSIVGMTDGLKSLIKDYGFDKFEEVDIFVKKKNKKKSGNSYKYWDDNGITLRGTTSVPHIAFVFDMHPEIADEIEELYKAYGIKRMKCELDDYEE